MNEALQMLKTRRSVRSYQTKQVEKEVLDQILEAGTYAASGMNKQSAIMIAVQDPEMVQYLSKLNAGIMGTDGDPFYGAPTVVVVLANRAESYTYLEDGCLVMGNLMNAAASLGVDSCWIHRAKQMFELPEGKELLKQWGIQGDYVGIGNCILGYGAGEKPEAKPRKENYVYRV